MPDELAANAATIQRLREHEQWLAAILRNTHDCVIAADRDGRIQTINSAAEALTGWSAGEALGRKLGEVLCVINNGTNEAIADPVAVLLSAECASTGRLALITKEGILLPIEHRANCVLDDQARTAGLIVIFRLGSENEDIAAAVRQSAAELSAHAAEQAAHNAELAALNEELRTRNEELDAFSHMVAHDLKNPLNIISGFAQLMAEAQPPANAAEATRHAAEQASYAVDIVRAAHKMSNIIQELLLLAEVRKADVPVAPLEMDLLIEEAVHRLAHLLQDSGAELNAPGRWPAAIGYGPWVEEVWANYLSNALKYGGQPPIITLGAEALPAVDGVPKMVRFWVRDEGPGIAVEDQARLFQPFSRLARVRAAGHGLGLSIARRIVEKLGGAVAVESAPGRGSTFSFTLPAPP